MGCPAPPCTGISPTMLLPESAGLALGFATMPHALAHTDTVAGYDAYAAEVGDDNENGIIEEDESGWNCTTMGNRICGVGNAQGAIPGDWTTTDADGNPVAPHASGPYAWDGEDYVGGYN
jgi:hypothetical protein